MDQRSAGTEITLKTGFIDVLLPLCSPPGLQAPSHTRRTTKHRRLAGHCPLRTKAGALDLAASVTLGSPAAPGPPWCLGLPCRRWPLASAISNKVRSLSTGSVPLLSHLPLPGLVSPSAPQPAQGRSLAFMSWAAREAEGDGTVAAMVLFPQVAAA